MPDPLPVYIDWCINPSTLLRVKHLFFVKSAWAYVEAGNREGRESGLKVAHKIWDEPAFRNGSFFGESENLYFQKVYRGVDALDAEFESLSLDIISPLIAALSEES